MQQPSATTPALTALDTPGSAATPAVSTTSQGKHWGHSFLTDTAAALLSSSLYTTAFYPIHRVKTLLQTQDWHPDVQSGKRAPYVFTTSFVRLAKEQGVLSLWRGNFPYMLRHVPSTTLSFAFKDALQRALPAADPDTQPWSYLGTRLLSGGVAGVLALAVVYPLDFATIRMAANLGAHDPGLVQTLTGSTRRGGLTSLYRGFGVSAVAIGGYKALYFGLYDWAKAYMHEPGHPHHPLTAYGTTPGSAHSNTGNTSRDASHASSHSSSNSSEGSSSSGGSSAGSSSSSGRLSHRTESSHSSVTGSGSSGSSIYGTSSHSSSSSLQGVSSLRGSATSSSSEGLHDGSRSASSSEGSSSSSRPSHSNENSHSSGTSVGSESSHISGTSSSSGSSSTASTSSSSILFSSSLTGSAKFQELLVSWAVASGVVYIATTITYPLDVIRKRLVVDGSATGGARQFSGFWDCVSKVWAREGVRGFYRFYGYDMVLRFGGGILLVMYDEVRGGLRQSGPHKEHRR